MPDASFKLHFMPTDGIMLCSLLQERILRLLWTRGETVWLRMGHQVAITLTCLPWTDNLLAYVIKKKWSSQTEQTHGRKCPHRTKSIKLMKAPWQTIHTNFSLDSNLLPPLGSCSHNKFTRVICLRIYPFLPSLRTVLCFCQPLVNYLSQPLSGAVLKNNRKEIK